MHAWMIVDGERFDPVFWVQDIMVSEYNEDPVVARSLRRSDVRLKQIVQDTIEKLDKAIA